MQPSQTFNTIQQLLNYVNSLIVPNGVNSITGDETNNVMNGLANFIQSYTMNNKLAGISSSTGVVPLSKPITIFTVVPTSFNWADNVQEEYYIINGTGQPLPITAGYSFTDSFGTVQTSVAPNDSAHISKATNATWYRVNNVSGSGGGGGLPPQTSNQGRALFTNGSATFWGDLLLQIPAGDANYVTPTHWVNGHAYTLTLPSPKFAFFWNETNRFLLTNVSPVEYDMPGNGFNVYVGGFDGSVNNVFLFFKGANS